MRDIIFWGASGQAKVLAEIAALRGYRLRALFDRAEIARSPIEGIPIFHGKAQLEAWLLESGLLPDFTVTIGGANGMDRIEIHGYLVGLGLAPATLVHPTSYVAGNARIGAGSQILAQSAVCVEVQLGLECIVNTAATIDHECIIGDGVHIGPGAHLAGLVGVGDGVFIGTGAIVLPRIQIGAGSIIGAGAIVTRDVPAGLTMIGAPAHPIYRQP